MADDYYDEDWDEAFAEDWEEARRPRSRRVATAQPRQLVPRPSGQPVTQTQFQVAISQVNSAIAKNSTAIQQVNSRVAAVDGEVRRQMRTVRNNTRDVDRVKEFLLIFPLLQQALGEGNEQLAAILPFILLGYGSDSGDGGGGGGGLFGGGTSSLLLVLALTGGLSRGGSSDHHNG